MVVIIPGYQMPSDSRKLNQPVGLEGEPTLPAADQEGEAPPSGKVVWVLWDTSSKL